MGRIEDAVAKLQALAIDRDLGAGGTPLREPLVPRRDSSAAAPRAYGGRAIELDVVALRAKQLLPPESQERVLAQEYRAIKRPLLMNANPPGAQNGPRMARGNLLVITSAMPGEGKTFTSLNLCLSFARDQDWSVVLVDGDIQNPTLSRALGIEPDLGLMDVLRDRKVQFSAHVMPTSVPRLAVLPAGTRGDDAAELIGSVHMDKMLAELAAEDPKRLIVFDSAPLLASSETPILASLLGQTVLVVLAWKTPRRAITAALERLDRAKPINLLLNQASPKHEPGAYGETYGYGG